LVKAHDCGHGQRGRAPGASGSRFPGSGSVSGAIGLGERREAPVALERSSARAGRLEARAGEALERVPSSALRLRHVVLRGARASSKSARAFCAMRRWPSAARAAISARRARVGGQRAEATSPAAAASPASSLERAATKRRAASRRSSHGGCSPVASLPLQPVVQALDEQRRIGIARQRVRRAPRRRATSPGTGSRAR
jgi:hypothetical protein